MDKVNSLDFIENDPICVPHRYTCPQDIEIAAFFSAILAWGNRKTIIQKATELMVLMGNDPYSFILHHQPKDLKSFVRFKHRTFQPTDGLFFIEFLKSYYSKNQSLDDGILP